MPYTFPLAWIIAGLIALGVILYRRSLDKMAGIYLLTSISAILSGLNLVLPWWIVWLSMLLTIAYLAILLGIIHLLNQARSQGNTWGCVFLALFTFQFLLLGVLGHFRDYWWLCCR